MSQPTYEDADALLADLGKARARGGTLTPRDVAKLFLDQAYRTGTQDAGGPMAVRRLDGRRCGCPLMDGRRCAVAETEKGG